MTYKELLRLYKSGGLSAEQREQIEIELEKQEAINEYLFDNEQIPEFSEFDLKAEEKASPDGFDEKNFLKMIKKSIRRAFLKLGIGVGVAVVAVVLAVILFINNILPGIIVSRYYNPGQAVGYVEETGNETNKMTLDTAVYTELFNPGYYRIKVNVNNEGGGNYDIHIPQNFSLNGQFRDVYGTVEKGTLRLFGDNIFRVPDRNVFATENTEGIIGFVGQGAAGDKDTALKKLQHLSDTDYYVGYITLSRVMSYEEFAKWSENAEVAPEWCAMCRRQETDEYIADDIVGFNFLCSSGGLGYDKGAYPYLTYNDVVKTIEDFPAPAQREVMETHVQSMLRYMYDNREFGDMVGSAFPEAEYYRYLQSVEEYGIDIYGFAVVAQKEELLRISELEDVNYVCTEVLR